LSTFTSTSKIGIKVPAWFIEHFHVKKSHVGVWFRALDYSDKSLRQALGFAFFRFDGQIIKQNLATEQS